MPIRAGQRYSQVFVKYNTLDGLGAGTTPVPTDDAGDQPPVQVDTPSWTDQDFTDTSDNLRPTDDDAPVDSLTNQGLAPLTPGIPLARDGDNVTDNAYGNRGASDPGNLIDVAYKPPQATISIPINDQRTTPHAPTAAKIGKLYGDIAQWAKSNPSAQITTPVQWPDANNVWHNDVVTVTGADILNSIKSTTININDKAQYIGALGLPYGGDPTDAWTTQNFQNDGAGFVTSYGNAAANGHQMNGAPLSVPLIVGHEIAWTTPGFHQLATLHRGWTSMEVGQAAAGNVYYPNPNSFANQLLNKVYGKGRWK